MKYSVASQVHKHSISGRQGNCIDKELDKTKVKCVGSSNELRKKSVGGDDADDDEGDNHRHQLCHQITGNEGWKLMRENDVLLKRGRDEKNNEGEESKIYDYNITKIV